MPNFCSGCGEKVKDSSSTFCSICGTKLDGGSPSPGGSPHGVQGVPVPGMMMGQPGMLGQPLLGAAGGALPLMIPGMEQTATGYRRFQSGEEAKKRLVCQMTVMLVLPLTMGVVMAVVMTNSLNGHSIPIIALIGPILMFGIMLPLIFFCTGRRLKYLYNASTELNDSAQTLSVNCDPVCTCCPLWAGTPSHCTVPYHAIQGVTSKTQMHRTKRAVFTTYQVWLVCAPGTQIENPNMPGGGPPGQSCLLVDGGMDPTLSMNWQSFLSQRPGINLQSNMAQQQAGAVAGVQNAIYQMQTNMGGGLGGGMGRGGMMMQ
eukprot:TRINITY_DN7013_c0_g2_i1.p1 TRINITY_DN7013_c0_g2~~TRINITY_DN7013_c0_g2_i1.p1  ORF type:complete len:349 (+),score=91.57 TRINITY_DN7013_c0_g2_i1:100-1047(+)